MVAVTEGFLTEILNPKKFKRRDVSIKFQNIFGQVINGLPAVDRFWMDG
jgi:hypothetical protein